MLHCQQILLLIASLILVPGTYAQEPSVTSVKERQQRRIETIARISPSVVCVMPANGQGGGSGVLISADGYAVSNYHVTSGSGNFMKCGLNDGNVYDAVIVGIDPTGDVALLKLLGRDDFPFCTPGDSDLVRIGDEVMALGNPFLLAADFSPTVTYGIVSGIHRYQYPAGTFLEYTDCIQIDASINPGNSGGPLFDISGNWIGINGRASFEKRGRVNTGAAYAISVRQVLLFLDHLKSGRIVDHGRTGFTVTTTDEGLVEVTEVSQLSESWRRGLRPGDELVSFADRAIQSANDFKNILGIFPEGTRIPMAYRNKDGIHRTTVRLLPLHGFQQAPKLPEEQQPDPEPAPDEQTPPETDGDKPYVPKKYAHLFEQRDGFANYYFNSQLQTSLLSALHKSLSNRPDAQSANWTFEVSADSENNLKPGELGVGRQAAYLQLPGQPSALQPRSEYDLANEPNSMPGLLCGMLQLYTFLNTDTSAYSEIIYHGTETLHPINQKVSVLKTQDEAISSRWYFTDGNPLPVGVDVHVSAGADEARLLFDNWNASGAIPFPGRLGVVDSNTGEIKWLDVKSLKINSTNPVESASVSRQQLQGAG